MGTHWLSRGVNVRFLYAFINPNKIVNERRAQGLRVGDRASAFLCANFLHHEAHAYFAPRTFFSPSSSHLRGILSRQGAVTAQQGKTFLASYRRRVAFSAPLRKSRVESKSVAG